MVETVSVAVDPGIQMASLPPEPLPAPSQAMEPRGGQTIAAKGQVTGADKRPMSPAERRVVHIFLKDNPRVTTASEGSGENRRVKISPA